MNSGHQESTTAGLLGGSLVTFLICFMIGGCIAPEYVECGRNQVYEDAVKAGTGEYVEGSIDGRVFRWKECKQ